MGSMSFTQFLFSFEGRVSRSAYWLKFYLPMIAIYIVLAVLMAMFAPAMDQYGTPMETPGAGFAAMQAIFGLFALAALWPSLAVSVKRWHDRDKSGWWILISLVPIIGGLWYLIECGFLKGTDGPNRFGADPLGSGGGMAEPAMQAHV